MAPLNKVLFEELLADESFVAWASGKSDQHLFKWMQWKNEHPADAYTFDEARRMVRLLRMEGTPVPPKEVDYLWQKTERILRNKTRLNVWPHIIKRISAVAAVLILPLIMATVWLLISNYKISEELTASENSDRVINTIFNTQGAPVFIDLPDGSKVWLNANSKLTYPEVFEDQSREVTLVGEGYFKIEKGRIPFLVKNSGPDVKVYGTEFNVNAFNYSEHTKVSLVSGKVSLLVDGNENVLKPGYIASFNKSNGMLNITKGGIDQEICWREGKHILKDVTLRELLVKMKSKYNVNFELKDQQLGDYKYNITLRDESLEQILDLLSLTAPIKTHYTKPSLTKDGTYLKGKVKIERDKSRSIR
ncbi:MAG: FecR family protein [Marinilabiliaceae bacterium]|nr:FecR family protein [Marinilabiliaceae bacterium]